MFQRFSGGARAVVRCAHEEARALGADAVGQEHLLLALAMCPGPAAGLLEEAGAGLEELRSALEAEEAEALAAIGISLGAVRDEVESILGPGAWDGRRRPRSLPFTGEAKDALEATARQAAGLRHRRLLPEHLLLALLVRGGRARTLLVALGVSPTSLADEVLDHLAWASAR